MESPCLYFLLSFGPLRFLCLILLLSLLSFMKFFIFVFEGLMVLLSLYCLNPQSFKVLREISIYNGIQGMEISLTLMGLLVMLDVSACDPSKMISLP